MTACKPVKSPVNPDVKLTQCENDDDVWDQKTYQAIVSSLLYLSTRTSPVIAYAVGIVSRFSAKPNKGALDSNQEDFEIPEGNCQPWAIVHSESFIRVRWLQ